MSVHFTLRCLLCEEDGPEIRLSNGITWLDPRANGWEETTRRGADWAHDFLLEHQYHGGGLNDYGELINGGLILVHE